MSILLAGQTSASRKDPSLLPMGCHASTVPSMNSPIEIAEDDLSGAQTRQLLALHLGGMHANSPPGHVFALDLSGLKSPGVTVWSARIGDRVAGIGALKDLGGGHGELKSMRTHPDFLRRGVAAAILERVIAVAGSRGMRRLSLETGRGPAFEPALALYRKRGFTHGEAFADYAVNGFSQFLHLVL
jgi:putative acetyltransferase